MAHCAHSSHAVSETAGAAGLYEDLLSCKVAKRGRPPPPWLRRQLGDDFDGGAGDFEAVDVQQHPVLPNQVAAGPRL